MSVVRRAMMKAALRSLVVCLGFCLMGLAIALPVAFAEGSRALGGTGGSSLESPLVVPEAQLLLGGEGVSEAEEARRDSPEAVAAREASQAKYEGLSAEQAEKADGEAFPGLVDEPAGGPPKLPAGESVTGFPSDDVAQVDLGEGRRGVVESTVPMAVDAGPGQRVPVDLGLAEVGGAFEPKTPVVGVRIPKRLGEGVQLPGVGVSLEPVDAQGDPLGGSEGSLDGASVVFANTQTDADVVAKPTTLGFEADTLLRSVESPRQLFYRVGLREGASLVQAAGRPGEVEVVDEGSVLAWVLAPVAVDAAGTPVPVSMSVSGDMLSLSVDEHAGEYEYPIEVDPTVVDKKKAYGNWKFTGSYTKGGKSFCREAAEEVEGGYSGVLAVAGCSMGEYPEIERSEYGYYAYTTEGESKVESFKAETFFTPAVSKEYIASYMTIGHTSYEAGPARLPYTTGWNEVSVGSPSYGNSALFEVIAEKNSTLKEIVEFTSGMYHAEVLIGQENGPSASFDTADEVVNGELNALYGGRWINTTVGKWGFKASATDPGLGIDSETWSSPSAPKWGIKTGEGSRKVSCKEGSVQCEESVSSAYPLKGERTEQLPEGEDKIEMKVADPVGLTATASGTVKIDNVPPYDIKLANGGELGESKDTLGVEATDGSGSTVSSGIKSIAITIDGREVGAPRGSCSPGPCTAMGNWPINGDEWGAGEHKVRVVATDNAGNVATGEFTLKVHHATPVSVGPGAVDPQSGEFTLSATDVSVGAPGSSLMVSRHYGSRHLTAGSEGPLGPQWSLSVGGQESITKLTNGSVTLTAANGGQSTFTSSGGGKFTSPPGDASLSLSEVMNEKGELTEYVLKDAADSETTRFTSTSGPTGSLWKPTKQEGPLASQTVRYSYGTVEGVTRPLEALAPEPAGVSCGSEPKELKAGCRALTFKYAEETTAKGEGLSEWGEYKGRLSEIVFHSYSPAAKAMEEVPVAEYSYDKLGRLRAAWDPQVSPALKTTYGYDAEGHVVALTPPGQESWAFTYSDSTGETGRLLKATQAPASAGLWDGETPVKTVAPKVSGSTVVGVTLGVSNGTWSNGPVAYSYQWERCHSSSGECTPITGAISENYTVTTTDVGKYLRATVTTINGEGSVAAASAGAGPAEVAAPITEYGLSESGEPQGITAGPDGNLWFTNHYRGRIGKITPSGTITENKLPSSEQGEGRPEAITPGPAKESALWFTDSFRDNIGKITTSGTISECALRIARWAPAIVAGPEKEDLWFTVGDETYPGIGKRKASVSKLECEFGSPAEYSIRQGYEPYGIAVGPGKEEALWFTEYGVKSLAGHAYIGKVTTSGTVTEYELKNESEPRGITAGPDGNVWFTEYGTSKIGKFTISTGKISEYPLPSGSDPKEIAAGLEKEEALWFTERGTGRLGKITTSGKITEYSLPTGSEPEGITAGPGTEKAIWFTDEGTSKIGKINVSTPTEGEHFTPGPGWTIEYNVPVSGAGLPNLTKEEVEKWGQTDDPTEGMAIFPPDEPQSWPASKYTRATIDYVDGEGRAVNTSSPTGGISTTEYNAYNDVVRTLSPDNRAAALKETGKTAEVSKELDTESTYEEKGSEPGTQLLETLGPRHTVKLAQGKEKPDEEALAREHVKYYYNEGAPSEGGPYDLVTKTIDGAQTASKEEFDKRETTTSYSGQENLGWKLRKPTSVTTDPSGLKLTHTISYEASTGETSETRMPANTKEKSPHATETIYYTTAANSKYAACGEHPEWANLPCQTQPAKQPETSGLPNLPVTTYNAYNIWDEPEKTTETVEKGTEKTTRTKTETYDAAGRPKTSAISSTVGTALPTVTDEYDEKTGALEKQCTNEGKPCTEGKPKTITSVYNTLGQLTSYTDADENTTTYEYEKEKDARLIKVNDGKGTETYKYNTTTGLPEELLNEYSTSKLAFTATYDVEGNMLSEHYPNGMSANYTYNQVGKPVSLEYKKTTDCTEEKEKCVWFKDSVSPSIHGQSLEQTSTLSHQAYTYDAAGRLTQVQNTPAGKGCTTRIYAYEEDTNRTSLTTREPNAKGECATEKGTEEKHTYDEADRLTDTGVKYNEFGDITALPAQDAGGKEPSEELTSTYYTDNQLASQTQNGETIGYNLDPAGRTLETVSTGKKVGDVVSHYAGPRQLARHGP